MYYSAAAASLMAFGATTLLPHDGVFWMVARFLLDVAGALFGLYLVIMFALSAAGYVMRFQKRSAVSNMAPWK